MATTYQCLYLDIRRRFLTEGLPGASLEARELVCFGSGKSREELYRDGGLYVPPETEQAILQLAERHLSGEPVAYLIGEWEFYGLPLDISPDVLIPRPDTEVLVEEAIRFLKPLGDCRVLDLCTGSGCIGLAVASHVPEARVLLGDISQGALRISRQNIRRNALTGRVSAIRMDALQPPPEQLGKFRCILCNPPYIPDGDAETLDSSVRDFEPHLALFGGADGCDFYSAILRYWTNALCAGGRLYFEVGIHQASLVRGMMQAHGFGELRIVEDGQGIPRVVYGTLLG